MNPLALHYSLVERKSSFSPPPILVLSAFQIKFLPVLILVLITPDDLVMLIRKGSGQFSSDEIGFCWKAITH